MWLRHLRLVTVVVFSGESLIYFFNNATDYCSPLRTVLLWFALLNTSHNHGLVSFHIVWKELSRHSSCWDNGSNLPLMGHRLMAPSSTILLVISLRAVMLGSDGQSEWFLLPTTHSSCHELHDCHDDLLSRAAVVCPFCHLTDHVVEVLWLPRYRTSTLSPLQGIDICMYAGQG